VSYEAFVREKHRFEHSIREMSEYVAVMSNDEIELALGRLADRVQLRNQIAQERANLAKAFVLRAYIVARRAGLLKQRRWARRKLMGEAESYYWELGRLEYAKALAHWNQICWNQQKLYEAQMEEYFRALKEWKHSVRGLTLRKKIFARGRPKAPKRPSTPEGPDSERVYASESAQRTDLGEFLITKVADFPVENAPADINGYSEEQILNLVMT